MEANINTYGLTVDQIKSLTIEVLNALPKQQCGGMNIMEAKDYISSMKEVSQSKVVKIEWFRNTNNCGH
jgi:hypothetical protein